MKIGAAGHEFFAQNLNYGTMISGAVGSNQSDDNTVEKYCYNDDPVNCEKYGALYQWAEAMAFPSACNTNATGSALCPNTLTIPPTPNEPAGRQQQGLCPSGWHVMTDGEWSTVASGNANLGDETRSATAGWATSLWNGNYHGFSAVPSGTRKVTGDFFFLGTRAYYWVAIEYSSTMATNESIMDNSQYINTSNGDKNIGFVIRCTKNW